MSAKSTMIIRVSRDIKDKLDRLVDGTRRGRSDVAVEAIEADVERELEIIEGIGRGLPMWKPVVSSTMMRLWGNSTRSSLTLGMAVADFTTCKFRRHRNSCPRNSPDDRPRPRCASLRGTLG